MIFGAHCSTAGGVWKALERAEAIGADVCQIFVKNNMQWLGRAHAEGEARRFAEGRGKLAAVFAHAGYLINLAAPPSANRDKSIESMIQEITLAEALELPFVVLHPGAHLGAGGGHGNPAGGGRVGRGGPGDEEGAGADCAGEHGRAGELPGASAGASGGDF